MSGDIPKEVRKDILAVLKKAQRHINNGNTKNLKRLSDYAINNISIFQHPDSLSLAVIVYALSKLLERWGPEGEYAEQSRNLLGSAQHQLEQDDIEGYRAEISKTVEFIAAVDKKFRIYMEKVIEKAQIKKGSRLYEYGISPARVAELLGIGQWELLSYIGKTRIHDETDGVSDVEQRLKYARSLFTK